MGPTENMESNITSFKGITAGWYISHCRLSKCMYPPVGTATFISKDLLRKCHWGWDTPHLLCLTEETLVQALDTFKITNSASHISRKPIPLKVQQRMSQYTKDVLNLQLRPTLLTLSNLSFKCFLTSGLVIIVTTRQLPFYSDPSLFSVLHLFHPNYIWALLPEDMDTVSSWVEDFRRTTQWTSFYATVTHSLSTGHCPGSRWHLQFHRSTEISTSFCLPSTT